MRRGSCKLAVCLLLSILVSTILTIQWNPVVSSSTSFMKAWGWDDNSLLLHDAASSKKREGRERSQYGRLCSDEEMTPLLFETTTTQTNESLTINNTSRNNNKGFSSSPPRPQPRRRGATKLTLPCQQQAELFSWRAGGVRGPSLAEVETSLHELYASLNVRSMNVLKKLGPCAFPGSSSHSSLPPGREAFMLERYLVDTSLELKRLDEAHSGDDCRYRLPPHQRAMCLAMAILGGPPPPNVAASENNSTTTSTSTSSLLRLHELPHYRDTHCRVLSPCLDWSRGTFTTTLSTSLLQHVYHHLVLPKVQPPPHHSSTMQWFAKQLIHNEENRAEWPWLLRRSKTMELDLEKRRSLYYSRAPPPPVNPRKRFTGASHIPQNLPRMWSSPSWHESSTDMSPLLQGEARSSLPTATTTPLLPLLPPIELLATLWTMVGPSVEEDVINVMVFNGDSVNRELFHRLIHYLRYGVAATAAIDGGSSGDEVIALPHFHYATHYDMVYVVHRDYDELLGFHSPQTNGSSSYTVERYFRAVRRNVTSWLRRKKDGTGIDFAEVDDEKKDDEMEASPAALLYIVWLWDPFTSASREIIATAPISTSLVSDDQVESHDCTIMSNASMQPPLVSYNVRPSVVIQGTGFWERQQGQQLMDMLAASALGGAQRLDLPRLSSSASAAGAAAHGPSPPITARSLHPKQIFLLTPPSEELLQDLADDMVPPYSPRTWGLPGVLGVDIIANKPLDPQDQVSNTTTHYNLIKNQHFFTWISNITRLRKEMSAEMHTAINGEVAHPSSAPPPPPPHGSILKTSVHLLDKAKIQFFDQHTLRDKIHFTCRATFAFAKPRFFEGSMAEWTLGRLFLPVPNLGRRHSTTDDVAKRGVGNFSSSTTMSLLVNSTLRATAADLTSSLVRASWCPLVGPWALSPRRLGKFWFKILKPSRVRYELWNRLGMETSRIRGPIVTGVLLPKAVIHPELALELEGGHVPQVQQLSGAPAPQVYVNVDSPRVDCSDDGDNILLHTLAQYAASKDPSRAGMR
ncbi:membrane-associated protein, putative [Bodo saltans]|uniref:Membrane-associated protein, putative n=1 Tax=Bodo saltans TaxID=75058 RepID=A0A0S4JI43_BODSA|nr:membrane-associated protein, putative [Bodo saltans]|eukprot:CUG89698.1 membrane-associated protein, putative [Bodo saltans]